MSRVPDQWIRTKSDEVAVDRGCYFDLVAADRVRYFGQRFIRHSKGEFAGKPFELLDWQWERLIAPAFGWKMPDGTRRFRRIGCAVPKKNGKSTLLSLVGLYCLCWDNEPGAEVYSAAADRKQAGIIYNEAANMVEASDALTKRIQLRRASKQMSFPQGKGTYEALSSEVGTKDGINIHCLLFDELHTQKTRDLWNVLRYGGAARRQPMLWWITTAGIYDDTSLCYEQWQQAVRVQDGRSIDISLLSCIYETPAKADWSSEETWKQANPSYGITINRRDMQEAYDEAKASPVNENNFRRFRLNQWTRQETKWISMESWDKCARTYTQQEQKGQRCWLGLDLSTTTDLTAAVALFKDGLQFRCLPYFWLPEAALKTRERDNRTRLDEWARQGFIKLTPGDVVSYEVVRADLNGLADIFNIREYGIDPWNATQIATDLQSDGFTVEYVRTGYASISAASKDFEKLILGGQLEHPSNPVLDWMVSNVATEQDASGNIKPSKKKSSEKIDGVVALIIALARAIKTLTAKPSVYETRGIATVGGRRWGNKKVVGGAGRSGRSPAA